MSCSRQLLLLRLVFVEEPAERREEALLRAVRAEHGLTSASPSAEEGAVNVLRRRRRCGTELLAEERPQRLVGVQRLSRVAACRERLHQIPVAALPEGSLLDEDSRGPLRGVELAAPDPEARLRSQLKSAEIGALEVAAALLEPGRIGSRDERSHSDVLGGARAHPRACPVLVACGRLGAVNRGVRRLDVNPGVLPENAAPIASPLYSLCGAAAIQPGRPR